MGLRSRLLPPCLLAAGLAVACLLTPSPARAAEPGVVPDLNWGVPSADQERIAAALTDMGARWVRLHAEWKNFEPTSAGSYNSWWLAHTDRAVQLADEAGVKIVLMVYNAPSWASGSSSRNTPRNAPDFANFMRFIAERYRGQVDAYEIWNEENTSRFWNSGPSAGAYTALLKAAYPAVKAGDPSALVVFGGLSTNDYAFVEATYAAGAKGFFDVMAVHPYPYCGSGTPETVRYGSNGRMTRDSFPSYREVRASMLARGDDKPIWITEFGWTTSTRACDPGAGVWQGGVDEDLQAGYLTRSFELLEEDPYVQAAFVYNLRNNYWSHDADSAEARYGLLRTDFTPKPAYFAFKSYAESAGPPPAPTGVPPTVALTAPVDGSTFGRTLAMGADASDDVRLDRVEFWLDDSLVAVDLSAPYSATWTVPKEIARGPHTLTAKAIDFEGLTATASLTVTRVHGKTRTAVARMSLGSFRTARTSSRIVRGRVAGGAESGRVVIRLQRYVPSIGHFGRGFLRSMYVRADGMFARRMRLMPGRWRVQARFRGNDLFLASTSGYRYFLVR